MKKEKLHVKLITDTNIEEYNLLGEYDRDNKIIIYYESNNLKSKMTINLKENTLEKDNIDYNIKLKFILNEISNGRILLKKEDKELDLELKTDKIVIKDDEIIFSYNIMGNNKVELNIKIGG